MSISHNSYQITFHVIICSQQQIYKLFFPKSFMLMHNFILTSMVTLFFDYYD